MVPDSQYLNWLSLGRCLLVRGTKDRCDYHPPTSIHTWKKNKLQTGTGERDVFPKYGREQPGLNCVWADNLHTWHMRNGMVQDWMAHFVTPWERGYDGYDWWVMIQKAHKKHKLPNKHHHHGGGAARPYGGVDLMNPQCPRGGRPCAYLFRGHHRINRALACVPPPSIINGGMIITGDVLFITLIDRRVFVGVGRSGCINAGSVLVICGRAPGVLFRVCLWCMRTVRMSDCCLQGIEPCECKRKGHRWIDNRVFRLGSRKELRKEWDLWKRSPKTFWGI